MTVRTPSTFPRVGAVDAAVQACQVCTCAEATQFPADGAAEEDLANVSSLAALKAAVKAIVKAHPQAFTTREELQGCEPGRKLPSRRGRPAVVDESDDDDDGRDGDADQDDDQDDDDEE